MLQRRLPNYQQEQGSPLGFGQGGLNLENLLMITFIMKSGQKLHEN